jgi:hypothetical protein
MITSNVSLCTTFVIYPILHSYYMWWTIIRGYIFMYWTSYLLCVGCIVHYLFVRNIILHIFNKCNTNFLPFSIHFSHISSIKKLIKTVSEFLSKQLPSN